MRLFERNYLVRISDLDDEDNVIQFEVRPPFNVSFECSRKDTGGNSLDITIYGLGEKKRRILSKRNYEFSEALAIENGVLKSDPINGLKKNDVARGAKELIIELFIGYGDNSNLRLIYLGEIRRAHNTLSSSGFETSIECTTDYSARQRAYTSRTITNRVDAIEQLMKDAGLEVGNIYTVNNEYIRPKIMSGKPLDILNNMANNSTETFFTDNGKGYFLPKFFTLNTEPIQVRAETGLLNTPSRQSEFITFKSKPNPSFILKALIEVSSFVDPTVNGQYEIFDLTYVGEYEGESWVVDVQARAIGDTLTNA